MSFAEVRSKLEEMDFLTIKSSKRRTKFIACVGIAALFFFVLLSSTISFGHPPPPDQMRVLLPKVYDHNAELVKPKDLKVVAFVFYGRRDRVKVLECYLRRNLVEYGGWVDEVHWVANTDKQDDLQYLDNSIIPSHKKYKKISLHDLGFYNGFQSVWETVERGVMYVKIDDDVLYIADDTIPRIVTTKLTNPEYHVVSANMINNPLLGWVHAKLGAIHPYFPEFDPEVAPLKKDDSPSPDWHMSELPAWTGPENYTFSIDSEPLEQGHRWLPVRSGRRAALLAKTPIAQIEYDTWGTGIEKWPIAAQEHYSFLANLEKGNLDVYKAGKIWIANYERTSINCIAVWGDDVLDTLPITGGIDEEWITKDIPKKLGKSTVIDMQALAVHFAFGPQKKGMESTDLIARYRSYAKDNICLR
ncbi:MAG: hypothetical protein M1834_000049 [Cirrosporium novae-zelandiae]|nr:MAG: hypothetical protein M1834_000049 [Cirrosporium novae-zelandiae]